MKKITEILTKINALTQELETHIEKIRGENKALCSEVNEASKAYFADLSERKDKISEQIKAIEKQKDDVKKELKKMRPSLVNATVSGNAEDIKKIQERMAELKAQEASFDTQIDILYQAPIVGDDSLFDTAKELNDKLEESGQYLYKACSKITEQAAEYIKLWEKIKSNTETSWYGEMVGFREKNRGEKSGEFEKVLNYQREGGKCIERPKPIEGNEGAEKTVVKNLSSTRVY